MPAVAQSSDVKNTAAQKKAPAHPSGDTRFELLDKTLKRLRYQQDTLIEVLHSAQDIFGFVREDVLMYVAKALELPPSRVYGVATFYHLFSFKPKGEHSCTVCLGTACYVGGASAIAGKLEETYGIALEQTTPDGKLSLSSARCLGSCGLAPVMIVDGEILGKATPESVLEKLRARLTSSEVSHASS
jgi:bidirectional [NiFe] hydrogenase diaphorase subunit